MAGADPGRADSARRYQRLPHSEKHAVAGRIRESNSSRVEKEAAQADRTVPPALDGGIRRGSDRAPLGKLLPALCRRSYHQTEADGPQFFSSAGYAARGRASTLADDRSLMRLGARSPTLH